MIWIIAGGRNYRDTAEDYEWLDSLTKELGPPTEVVHGGASGADDMAHNWAKSRGYLVREFPAHWREEGRAAGPIRNQRMAVYTCNSGGGVCILFPGGKGTASMKEEAKLCGLRIIERPQSDPKEVQKNQEAS